MFWKYCVFGALSVLLLAGACAQPSVADRVERARARLGEGARLLESKQAHEFLVRFIHPRELAKLRAEGQFDEVLDRFAGEWGSIMRDKLKAVVDDREPEVEGDRISFSPSGPLSPMSRPIVLELHDGEWYIAE